MYYNESTSGDLMAKKKETEEANGNVLNPVELKDVALSIVKDTVNNDWVVVKIQYDFKSKKMSEPEVLVRERELSIIQERFRILVAQLIF